MYSLDSWAAAAAGKNMMEEEVFLWQRLADFLYTLLVALSVGFCLER
jgi:hypothetical protein